MRVLIVEDNKNKLQQIVEFLNNFKNSIEISITEAMSFTSGKRKIYKEHWDLIILDMSLPTFDVTHKEGGGDKRPIAGKEIMKRMMHKNIFIPVIIITQFETFGENKLSLSDINAEFEKDYKGIWRGTIFYEGQNWKNDFDRILSQIIH